MIVEPLHGREDTSEIATGGSQTVSNDHRPGRNTDGLETKVLRRQDFVIGGFTLPERARAGVGALLLG
jgi:bifunctional non-homologous end joining protein LigD